VVYGRIIAGVAAPIGNGLVPEKVWRSRLHSSVETTVFFISILDVITLQIISKYF